MSCPTFVRHGLTAAAALTALALAGGAGAQPAPAVSPRPAVVRDGLPDTAATAAPRPLLFAARRAGDKALSQQRGGTELASDASLQATVSGNTAAGNTTGSNLITGGSLAGASGVPVVVQNTGNNVLIQSATIVNVQLR